jgi:hypothetical protein
MIDDATGTTIAPGRDDLERGRAAGGVESALRGAAGALYRLARRLSPSADRQ